MAKLSETDTKPNTLPSQILDDANGLAINGLTFSVLSSYDDEELSVLDTNHYNKQVTNQPHKYPPELSINPNTYFSTNGIYSIPMKNTHTSSCPIDTDFGENEAEKRGTNSNNHNAQEKESIKKELEKIFKEICVITDKIRKEVYQLGIII